VLIDWFTVGAQAVNFIILVGLLRRFLYQPVLRAIDAREKRVAAQLEDAETKRSEASRERDAFQHKRDELEAQRAGLLSKATEEAAAERKRLIDEARAAADALSAKRKESLAAEARDLREAVLRRTRTEVFAIARKALTDLASTSLEASIVGVFAARVRALEGEPKALLARALATGDGPALVRSAYDLSAELRAEVQAALDETFGAQAPLRFDVAPDLLGGVEVTAHGQRVAWSIDGYLASMDGAVGELLDHSATAAPAPAPAPAPETEAHEHVA
jgi:F-type H+-transporting ATPase subunit b